MEAAAKEEADIAIANGHVDLNGTPLLTVVADGCWSKRSYRSGYNALFGAAAIVGKETSKVLYLGVKNKVCSICNKIINTQMNIDHICYKNYIGSSTSMKATIKFD